MFFAILSACLAANAPVCGDVLLARQGWTTLTECESASPRIADFWLAGRPALVQSDLDCAKAADLPGLPLKALGDGLYAYLGQTVQFEDSADGWIANLGVIIGADSIAVIDAGTSRQQGQALFAAIRRISARPISHLIITHVHPDHALGAEVFAEAGATIVGHARLGNALQAQGPIYLDNLTRLYGPVAMFGTGLVQPDIAVEDEINIDLGNRVLTLTAAPPAHSDSDLTVRDGQTGTLFAGDLVFRELAPIVDGSLPGWLDWLATRQADGSVIPGHGPVATSWHAAVGAQIGYLAALDRSAREMISSGLPMSEAVPAIVEALQPFADEWHSFPESAARDATAAYKELEWE